MIDDEGSEAELAEEVDGVEEVEGGTGEEEGIGGEAEGGVGVEELLDVGVGERIEDVEV